jgi:hypothetical protein
MAANLLGLKILVEIQSDFRHSQNGKNVGYYKTPMKVWDFGIKPSLCCG